MSSEPAWKRMAELPSEHESLIDTTRGFAQAFSGLQEDDRELVRESIRDFIRRGRHGDSAIIQGVTCGRFGCYEIRLRGRLRMICTRLQHVTAWLWIGDEKRFKDATTRIRGTGIPETIKLDLRTGTFALPSRREEKDDVIQATTPKPHVPPAENAVLTVAPSQQSHSPLQVVQALLSTIYVKINGAVEASKQLEPLCDGRLLGDLNASRAEAARQKEQVELQAKRIAQLTAELAAKSSVADETKRCVDLCLDRAKTLEGLGGRFAEQAEHCRALAERMQNRN